MHRFVVRVVAVALVALLVACSDDDKPEASASSGSSGSAVSASSSSSAPVDVPPGFISIPTPAGVSPDLFGQNVAVTTTRDNRPVVAFSVHAADGDASTVMTSWFDSSTGAFSEPLAVATAVLYDQQHSVGITRDVVTGALVVVWDDSGQIMLSQSKDDGRSWLETVTVSTNPGAHFPSVAAADGRAFISFADDDANVSLVTGDLSSATFAAVAAPQPADGSPVRAEFAPVAVAPDGSFGVAYLITPNGTDGVGVAYLKAGAPSPVVAMTTPTPNDVPSTALAYNDQGPVIAASMCMNDGEPGACTYVATSSDGGTTFAPPVSVPGDTGQDAPVAIALVVAGTNAVLSYVPASGSSDATCGNPKLAQSYDLQSWDVCTPGIDSALGFVAGTPALARGGDGQFVLAFQQSAEGAQSPTGVLVTVQLY